METFSFGDILSAPGKMVGGVLDRLIRVIPGGGDLVSSATSNTHPASPHHSPAATAQNLPRTHGSDQQQDDTMKQLQNHAPPVDFDRTRTIQSGKSQVMAKRAEMWAWALLGLVLLLLVYIIYVTPRR